MVSIVHGNPPPEDLMQEKVKPENFDAEAATAATARGIQSGKKTVETYLHNNLWPEIVKAIVHIGESDRKTKIDNEHFALAMATDLAEVLCESTHKLLEAKGFKDIAVKIVPPQNVREQFIVVTFSWLRPKE